MNDARQVYQRFKLGEATHPGNTGKNNEDSYGYIVSPVHDNQSGQLLVAVVADGIGGETAGEEAAPLAVKTIKDAMIAHGRADGLPQALTQAMQSANAAVYTRSRESPLFSNMGTTAAAVVVSDDQLYVANVGDSRVYLIRRGAITQLTTDHSWGQEALEAGRISPLEVRQHPNRNVLRRYLGVSGAVDVDLRLHAVNPIPEQHNAYTDAPLLLEPDDTLLLCTDGLTDLVSDPEICSAVAKNPAQQAADHLVEAARRRGGLDNITVLILKSRNSVIGARRLRRSFIMGVVGLLLLFTIALVAYSRLAAQPSSPELADNFTTIALVPGITPTATQPESVLAVSSPGTDSAVYAATPLPVASHTPLPTSTAIPTWTPAPTSTPTRAPTRTPSLTPAVRPTVQVDTATPSVRQNLPGLTLESPPQDDKQRRAVTFSWRPSGPLPKGTAYELVWWESGANADAAARSFAPPLTDTSLTVNLDTVLGGQRTINWTVLLVQSEPYARLTKPSEAEARTLYFQLCQEHEKCNTCEEQFIDPKTGVTNKRDVPCDCKTVCD